MVIFFYIYINLSSYYDETSLLIIHLIYTYNLFYIGNTINIILKKLNLHIRLQQVFFVGFICIACHMYTGKQL